VVGLGVGMPVSWSIERRRHPVGAGRRARHPEL